MHDTQLTTVLFGPYTYSHLTGFPGSFPPPDEAAGYEEQGQAHEKQRNTACRRHFVMHYDSEFEVAEKV